MTEQIAHWSGPKGDAYQDRNRVDWKIRRPFWERMLALTKAQTVLEVGCGPGWNLRAMLAAQAGPFLRGVDINQKAVDEARRAHLDVAICQAAEVGDHYREMFDLTFTAGMLIHIAPIDLHDVMASIVRTSVHHVLAIEYDAPQEEEIEYRGERSLLWKRPYGELYQAMGLRLLATGFAGVGFDNCTYWLLEKS